MRTLLIVNLGTTSFKYKLFAASRDALLVQAGGEIESVGAAENPYVLTGPAGQQRHGTLSSADHNACFSFCLDSLRQDGILSDLGELDAVGYKAVHGGRLSGTRVADEAVLEEMERMIPLAPAHNPVYLSVMRYVRNRYPGILQAVRFETSFHATVPDYRTVYGVPYFWQETLGIRKYGFHGSSHEYIAGRMAQLCPRARKIISCHLGGSSSLCAIRDGKSIATSMGATPQSGLFHNNRAGDFDVFCLPLLLRQYGDDPDAVLGALSRESGLLGLSGVSNDMRLVMDAMDAGDSRAALAVQALVDQILGYIGMYTAYLNGLDALVFTGGMGAGSSRLRQMVCSRLGYLGLILDDEKNRSQESRISTPDSRVAVYRIKTDEELVVASHILRLLDALPRHD